MGADTIWYIRVRGERMTYTVHRPKHFNVTLTWDIKADSREEAEAIVQTVVDKVEGELETRHIKEEEE